MKCMKYYAVFVMGCLFLLIILTGCTSKPPAVASATPEPISSVTVVVSTAAPTTSIATAQPSPTPIIDPTLLGPWRLKSMVVQGGTAFTFPMNVQITATFDNQGRITGYGGCNNYNTNYVLSGKQLFNGMGISVGPIASTRMFCADSSDTETTYLQILGKAQAYVVNGNDLTITDNLNSSLVFMR